MKRLVANGFLSVIVSSAPVLAEPIVVRSGEHESFTRIVLPIPDGAVWLMENKPGNSQIIFENHDDGFDLSLAFEVIPKTRLTALVAQDSLLEMQLTCDCPVTSFVEQNEFLVIDISDGPKLAAERPEVVALSRTPTSGFSYGELLWRNNEPEITLPAPAEESVSEFPSTPEPRGQSPVTEPELVLETQTRLLEAFSDAASRGLLDPVQQLQDSPSSRENNPPIPSIFDSSQRISEAAPEARGNIRVTNSNDVPKDTDIDDIALSGAVCMDPSVVEVEKWGTEDSFNFQLGVLNRELYDEIGRLRSSKVIELAKFYLHFGFGAEARQTLALEPQAMIQHPELLDLANILEYGFAPNPRSLHRFADCNSDLALWGFLTAREFPEDRAVNSKAALRGLQNLPSHLRYLLGPELSEKFLQRGEVENANLALRSFDSLLENEGKPPKMPQAQAMLITGADNDAKDALNEIIEEDTPDAPSALVALIQKLVEDDQPIPADIALLAESFSFELQDTEEGEEMLRAFVLASTKSAQYTKSFTVLQNEENPFDKEVNTELTSHLFAEISGKTSDAEFLGLYFSRYSGLKKWVDTKVQFMLAQRLLSIGFTEEAIRLSNSLPDSYSSNELRLLRADVLLRTEQYTASLLQLDGLEGSEASKLRGEILEQLGEHESASKAFDAADMSDRAVSNLWLSNDWTDLVEDTTPVFGAVSQLKNENPTVIPENNEMLAGTEAAISASAAARQTLEQTLQALELTEE